MIADEPTAVGKMSEEAKSPTEKESKEALKGKRKAMDEAAKKSNAEIKAEIAERKRIEELDARVMAREPAQMASEDDLSMSWERRERNRLRLIREFADRKQESKSTKADEMSNYLYLREDGFDYHMGLVRDFSRWRAHAGLIRTYLGADSRLYCVDVSEDNNLMLTASSDKQLRLWNMQSKECIRSYFRNEGIPGHRDEVRGCALFVDLITGEERFVSCSSDQTVKVWSMRTGAVVHSMRGHTDIVFKVAVSPDGQLAATCSADSTIRLWDLYSGSEIFCFKGHVDSSTGVCFSPDSCYIVSSGGYNDRSVRLWSVAVGIGEVPLVAVPLSPSAGPPSATSQATISTEHDTPASPPALDFASVVGALGDHETLHVKKLKKAKRPPSRKEKKQTRRPNKVEPEELSDIPPDLSDAMEIPITSDPDDFRVPYRLRERTAAIKELYRVKMERLGHESRLRNIKFFWNSSKQSFESYDSKHELPAMTVQARSDPSLELSSALPLVPEETVDVVEVARPCTTVVPENHLMSLLESVDEKGHIIAAPSKEVMLKRLASVRVASLADGEGAKPLCRFILGCVECHGVALTNGFCSILSHQRQLLEEQAILNEGMATVQVLEGKWAARTLECPECVQLDLLTEKYAGELLKEWEATDKKLRVPKKAPTMESLRVIAEPRAKDVLRIAAEEAGRLRGLLSFRAIRNSVRLDAAHNRGLACIFETSVPSNGGNCAHTNWVNDVRFSPDGRLIASVASDRAVKLWDLETGWLIRTMVATEAGPQDIIMSVQFSPTSHTLVTASFDKSVILWNYVTGDQLMVMRGHDDVIYDVRWTHDGNQVVTASYDRTIRLWQITPVFADPPNKPEHSTVMTDVDKHKSRLDLHWRRPNANGKEITAYVIQRQIRKQTEWGNEITVPPSSRDVILFTRIEPIKPGLTYQFRIASQNEQGVGSFGDPSAWITVPPAKPTRIMQPKPYDIRCSEVDLRWPMPDDMGAPILKFIIQYRGASVKAFDEIHSVEVKFSEAEAKGAKAMESDMAAERLAEEKRASDRLYQASLRTEEARRKKRESKMTPSELAEYQNGLQKLQKLAEMEKATPSMVGTVPGLEPGMQYQYRVCAVNRIGSGIWSKVSISAMCHPAAPAPPSPPVAVTATLHDISLEWEPPAERGSPITRMKLSYSLKGFDVELIFDKNDRGTTITGIDAGVAVTFRLAAENALGWSEWSVWSPPSSTLVAVPDKPNPPIVLDPKPTQLRLRWQEPYANGSPITCFYLVRRESETGAFGNEEVVDPKALVRDREGYYEKRISDLPADTLFEFRLIAENSLGRSKPSKSSLGTATLKPQTPLAPSCPKIKEITDASVIVGWEEPFGRGALVIGYKLFRVLEPPSDSSGREVAPASVEEVEVKVSALQMEVTRLKQKSTYVFKVRAFNKVGDSDWSPEVSATLLSKAQYIAIKAKKDEKERTEKARLKEGKKEYDSLIKDLLE